MIEDFVADDADHLKTLLAPHAVHNHVPVDADKMLTVQDRVFVLFSHDLSVLVPLMRRVFFKVPFLHTWPAVSIISTAKSWFLYLMTLENVFSMVG